MNGKTSIIALLAITLLDPLGVSTVFAQEIPGQESEWEPIIVNEQYPELSPSDAQHITELMKYEDPSLVNEYQELHQDIINWLADDSTAPVGLADDMKIAGTGTMGSAGLLITVYESNAHLIPEYKQVFENAYPHLNFEISTVGDVRWSTGEPTLLDLEAYAINPISSTATPLTIGIATETDDGEKGVVVPKHAFRLGETGDKLYSEIISGVPTGLIGSVITNSDINPGNILSSDSVFVEFEKEPVCHSYSVTYGSCIVIGYGDYLEIIPQHTIYGDDIYTVTDSDQVYWRDRVSMIGAVSDQLDTIDPMRN